MKTKLLPLLTLILVTTLLLVYQVGAFLPLKATAMDSTRFEYNTASVYSSGFVTNTKWLSQTFTPEISHIIKSVKLYVKKIYDIRPYLCVYICPVGPDGKPMTSEVLASGYYYFSSRQTWGPAWLKVSLGDGVLLQAGVTYSIVIFTSSPEINKFIWYNSRDYYAGGRYYYSADSGATWFGSTGFDCRFEEWGILPPQEPQIFENYNNTAGPGAIIYEPFQHGQTFIPQARHILSRIYLHGYVPFEYESQFSVKIMATSEGLPTGEPLAVVSVPHELLPHPGSSYWISIDIPDEPELQAGVMYAIVVTHDAPEAFAYRWTTDYDDDDGDYPGGTLVSSGDGGITWSMNLITDCCFQEWGYPLEL